MAEQHIDRKILNTGIYEIVNTVNGKRYVGSAVTIRGRFAVHRNMLRAGKHHSQKLQRAWSKYGEQAFEFRTLIVCGRAELLLYEQIVLDATAPAYNVARTAGSLLGHRWTEEQRQAHRIKNTLNNPFKGRKHSAETLAKMSLAHLGNSRTKGKPRSPEAIAKSAAAHRGMKRSDETRARISAARRSAATKTGR